MDSHSIFQQLLARARSGAPDAIRDLFHTYDDPLRRVVRSRLHQPLRTRFDSQDFLQEVWQRFFATELPQRDFQTPDELLAFLSGMARRTIITQQRYVNRLKRYPGLQASLDALHHQQSDPIAPTATPSQVIMAEEQWEQLIQNQRPKYREMLALLRRGHTHEEIADRLGVNTKTIQRLLRRIDPRLVH